MKEKLENIPKEELDEAMNKFRKETALSKSVDKVIAELVEALNEHSLPGSVIANGGLWVPTNRWKRVSLELDQYQASIVLALLWMDQSQLLIDINPFHPEVGRVPPGFGPGFELPHFLSQESRLTDMPTTSHGWATGLEPGIKQDYLAELRNILEEKISKLPWIKKEP